MKIKFVGCGSAFNKVDGQSNAIITSISGKKLLIDCGSYFWNMAKEATPEIKPSDINAVYISHLHADHIGGLEELAFMTYFSKLPRPKLYCNINLMKELWEQCLQGGLASIQGKVVTLTEYFECFPIENNAFFDWEDIEFNPVQTVHVMAGYTIKYSYGLIFKEFSPRVSLAKRVFFTTDVQFCPNQIIDFYRSADIIFQDCETAPYASGVHASYNELKTLQEGIKKKMYLYHYQPNPPQMALSTDLQKANWEVDGFAGFVQKGQEFEI